VEAGVEEPTTGFLAEEAPAAAGTIPAAAVANATDEVLPQADEVPQTTDEIVAAAEALREIDTMIIELAIKFRS